MTGFNTGPVAGLTRMLGAGFAGRIQGTVLYVSTGRDFNSMHFSRRLLTQDLVVAASRQIRLVGSLGFQPAVGIYATTAQQLSADISARAGGIPFG